jgi:hypothetical protein
MRAYTVYAYVLFIYIFAVCTVHAVILPFRRSLLFALFMRWYCSRTWYCSHEQYVTYYVQIDTIIPVRFYFSSFEADAVPADEAEPRMRTWSRRPTPDGLEETWQVYRRASSCRLEVREKRVWPKSAAAVPSLNSPSSHLGSGGRNACVSRGRGWSRSSSSTIQGRGGRAWPGKR